MSEKEFRKKELERILPLAWNSYQHMYDTRAKNIENQINFLLIVVSFLPVFSFMLFQEFDNNVFLVPILPQFIAMILLLKPFFIKNWPIVNWMSLDWVKESLSKKKFNQELLSSLKSLENITWKFQGIMKNIIKSSVSLIIISLYGVVLAVISNYLQLDFYLYLLIFILSILPTLLLIFYQKQPNFMEGYNADFGKFTKQIEDWLNLKP